jgi:hypothetical protein
VTTLTGANAITATIPRPMIARSTLLEQLHVHGRMHGLHLVRNPTTSESAS